MTGWVVFDSQNQRYMKPTQGSMYSAVRTARSDQLSRQSCSPSVRAGLGWTALSMTGIGVCFYVGPLFGIMSIGITGCCVTHYISRICKSCDMDDALAIQEYVKARGWNEFQEIDKAQVSPGISCYNINVPEETALNRV